MAKKFEILDGTPITLLEESSEDFGVEQLAIEGEWKGHWQGAFNVTSDMLQQMADFGNSRSVATVVDYGHASVFDSSAPAAGWIEPGQFFVKDKSLFGKIAWNPKALEAIKSGEIRYKSPTIVWNTRDRKTGKTGGASLHSVAITNTPFLTELPEVRVNAIASALSDLAIEESNMDDAQFAQLAKTLGLSDASPEGIISAAQTLLTKATALDSAQTRITELESEVTAFRAKDAQSSAEALVRTFQEQRKVGADGSENYKACLAHAMSDPEGFKVLMDSMGPWVGGGMPAVRSPESGSSELTAEQRDMNKRLGVSDETFVKFNAGLPQ